MKPIFLIGYMGSGKSTLGVALGRRTGVRFIDLDEYIEERAGMSVGEIFASRGEAEFRRMERDALAEVAKMSDVIVACGGGTPCRQGAMELMNESGTTVFLEASLERLHARLMEGRGKRPLIAGMGDDELRDFIVKSLGERLPYYRQATLTFCSDYLEDESQIAESCERFWFKV